MADADLNDVELQILWLHVMQGKSFADIANAVRLPRSTTYDIWVGVRSKLEANPALLTSLGQGEGTQDGSS